MNDIGAWVVSRSEEGPSSGNRAEAIASAAGELGLEPGDTFWVGQVASIDAEYVLPGIEFAAIRVAQDLTYEQVGDVSDGWLDRVSSHEKFQLRLLLQAAWGTWLKDHPHHQPKFFAVEGATNETVPEETP